MNQDDTYTTIADKSVGQYKDKGSRFIALAFPVETEEQIKEILLNIKNTYHDARHHCYAYLLGSDKSNYRINDDGEPSGTAGKPIFGQIQAFGLTNILLVVVRYFGGTKLGVRGLINAYKEASIDALNQAAIITQVEETHYSMQFDYLQMNEVMKIIKTHNLKILEHQSDIRCKMVFSVRNKLSKPVVEALNYINSVKLSPLSDI